MSANWKGYDMPKQEKTNKVTEEKETSAGKAHKVSKAETTGAEDFETNEVNSSTNGTFDTEKQAENDTESAMSVELVALKELADRKEVEAKEHYARLTYLAAEYDNFKRRSQKEKEKLYTTSVADVVSAFLPTLDNLERAMKSVDGSEHPETVSLLDGVAMVEKQLLEAMSKLGVVEMDALGKEFDPLHHHAVMHVEDDAFGHSEVVDVFQKGYIYKDGTVVRFAMVKVAN